MERGELERMGDSLGPGGIVELVGRRVKVTLTVFLKLGTDECETTF